MAFLVAAFCSGVILSYWALAASRSALSLAWSTGSGAVFAWAKAETEANANAPTTNAANSFFMCLSSWVVGSGLLVFSALPEPVVRRLEMQELNDYIEVCCRLQRSAAKEYVAGY